jgi:serine/threonine protein kinase
MPDASATAGHVVAERYRLVKRLGEGGMGEVWVADDMTLHSQVAIKLLHVQDSEEGLQRFSREAQAAARLRSPHVVQILEHGVDKGVPFIAMELLEGESLATRLARLSTLSLAQTARIVTHIARAIGKAHDAGIVHRDLKPDNVFIVHNDDEEIVKVLDFGIAKMEQQLGESAKISTQEGSLLGTPLYMSPEQVRGHGVDWRSDLWSLAMITFECVCGRLPFDGRTVGDILVLICSEPLPVPSSLRALPPAFDSWFAKAATRDVAKRFQSAKEMSDALRAIVGEETRTPWPADSSSNESARRVSEEATTLAADSGAHSSRSELERARTVSASGTIGGASSGVSEQRSPSRARLIGGALAALCAIGVVAYVARPQPPPIPAIPTISRTTVPSFVTVAATETIAAASASVIPSAAGNVTTTASISASATASARPHPTAHTAPRASQNTKSDEITF